MAQLQTWHSHMEMKRERTPTTRKTKGIYKSRGLHKAFKKGRKKPAESFYFDANSALCGKHQQTSSISKNNLCFIRHLYQSFVSFLWCSSRLQSVENLFYSFKID